MAAQPRKYSNEPFERISEDKVESFAIPGDSKSKNVSSKRRLSDCSLSTPEIRQIFWKKFYTISFDV